MIAQDRLEVATQEIGRKILSTDRGSFWEDLQSQMRLDDKLMGWAMSQEDLRVQLFHLIDCLPALQDKSEIARHMQEYLTFPGLRTLLNFSTENPQSPTALLAATTFETAVAALARKYICGENLPEAIKTIERLRRDRMTFTVDLLGEAVISEREAQDYLQKYLNLMTQLTDRARTWSKIPQINEVDGVFLGLVQVSVKLSAFYSQFDPLDPVTTTQKVSEPVRTLLRRARELGCAVHFDMEQYAYKDLTLAILKQVLIEPEFRERTDVGVTLQGYLRDSEQDLHSLVEWVKERGYPITVRLIKGAYWDQETIKCYQQGWALPVYAHKSSTDANFERLMSILLKHHAYLYAAIGSHNVRSLAKAIALQQALQIPQSRFELQALYGMGEKFLKSIVDMGYRVRIYCPYGELIPGMSYLIRRLLENTANSSFLRLSTKESRPVAELLAPPTMEPSTMEPVAISFDRFTNAPDTDFSHAISRQQQQQALDRVREQFGKTYLPIIAGQSISTETTIDSINPSQWSEVVGQIGMASLAQTDRAIEAAQKAFSDWKRLSATQRGDLLRKAADIMECRRYELSAWIVWEVGKPVREADAEVSEAIDFCRYYAKEMERLAIPQHRSVPGEENRYFYQPRGIAVVISPWNFPLAIAIGMTVAALAAGNCVILKPAAQSSVIGAKIAEILQEAGIPAGVFTYLPGKGSEIGMYLVRHPAIHLLAFTGSQAVGCQIYAEAAILQPDQRHLKRVIAEMGGKNAIIIDESADLDQAVISVVHSAFGYAGQKCSACSRVIVVDAIHDRFVERLVETTRSLQVGAAHLASTAVGPVIDRSSQQKILTYIEKGKTTGEVVLEMAAPDYGSYVGPTIVTGLDPDSVLAQEEIFGPVLSVLRASNFTNSLAIANNSCFALTGGLYSRTPSHIQQAFTDFEVGNLYINRGITGALVDRQPFGGFKLSGVGSKAGGSDYLLQFLEPRVITENTQRQGFAPLDAVLPGGL